MSPILDYAGEVWGFKDKSPYNKIQNRAIRVFLGVNSFSPNAGVQGDMGWLSPLVRRHKLMIKFWNRLIGMSQFRLTRKIFDWNYFLGNNNWATDIKALFTNIGMENVF